MSVVSNARSVLYACSSIVCVGLIDMEAGLNRGIGSAHNIAMQRAERRLKNSMEILVILDL